MDKSTLTKEQKEYIRRYMKRKTLVFFLYLFAAINQCLIILLGVILMDYNPRLYWLCISSYILGAIALSFFIYLIIDYDEEQNFKVNKLNN